MLACFMLGSAAVALEVPYLSGRVTDQADLLGEASSARITAELRQLELVKGAQVAVLTIPGLQGEVLEDFSMKVVETWKLGRKGVDDGVLLLIARDDRRIRIEVGYGLEGVLSDLDSRRIIDKLMQPAFRDGDFEGGIERAVMAISAAIMEEPSAIPAVPETLAARDPVGTGIFLAVFGVILIPVGAMAVAIKGRQAWTLYLFAAPFFYFVPLLFGKTVALVSLAAWLILVPLLRFIWPSEWQVDPGTGVSSGRHRGSSGGFSSGGGFSGGGGSFGGGGASGGW